MLITTVSKHNGDTAIVTLTAKELWGDSSVFSLTARSTDAARPKRIVWITVVNVIDRYGRKTDEPVLRLRIETSEMRKIEYARFPSPMMLNFNTIEHVAPITAKGAIQYCKNNDFARSFCSQLMRKLRAIIR